MTDDEQCSDPVPHPPHFWLIPGKVGADRGRNCSGIAPSPEKLIADIGDLIDRYRWASGVSS